MLNWGDWNIQSICNDTFFIFFKKTWLYKFILNVTHGWLWKGLIMLFFIVLLEIVVVWWVFKIHIFRQESPLEPQTTQFIHLWIRLFLAQNHLRFHWPFVKIVIINSWLIFELTCYNTYFQKNSHFYVFIS